MKMSENIIIQTFRIFLNYTMSEILQEDIPLISIYLGLIILLFWWLLFNMV